MLRIEPFLLDDEHLLGSCGTGRGIVCVTDRRLLRVERTLFGRRTRDLSYREVSSIAISDRPAWLSIGAGLCLVALGMILPRAAPLLLTWMDSSRMLRLTPLGTQTLLIAAAVLLVAGVSLAALGAVRRRYYVSLNGPMLLRSRGERRFWTFSAPTPSDARVFAGLVRQQLHHTSVGDRNKVLPFETS